MHATTNPTDATAPRTTDQAATDYADSGQSPSRFRRFLWAVADALGSCAIRDATTGYRYEVPPYPY